MRTSSPRPEVSPPRSTDSYLWAVGDGVTQIPAGTRVGGRYVVLAPHVWRDHRPGRVGDRPPELPAAALPYLHLHPHRLHLPQVHQVCLINGQDGRAPAEPVLLLGNIPVDGSGRLYPAIDKAWSQVTAVRQVYWLWQMLALWDPLQQQGVASSLLVADNLRVEGWRLRLLQLYADPLQPGDGSDGSETVPVTLPLGALAELWQRWVDRVQPQISPDLQEICQQMRQPDATAETVAVPLNQLLLAQAAQMPLRLQIEGGTSTGPQRSHNEDACYPLTLSPSTAVQPAEALSPRIAIVCDGIGGHAGGEVASQLAIRTLRLQLQALLTEVADQTEPLQPAVIMQQIAATVRVVNNLIASQNNAQGREARQRMATTLVLALQVPQQIETPTGKAGSHELYLAHVGDSRAYWLTSRYCQQLTVDDDVASREVVQGRSLYPEAIDRPDAAALTQALGTRDGEALRPTIQRFILEEDGLLLLCSDGLSDRNGLQESWENLTRLVLKGKINLATATRSWIDVANRHNGQDNTSVVLLQCQVSPTYPQLFEPGAVPAAETTSEWSEASRALLYGEAGADDEAQAIASHEADAKAISLWAIALGLAVIMFVGGVAGIFAWRQIDGAGFQRLIEQVLSPAPTTNPPPE